MPGFLEIINLIDSNTKINKNVYADDIAKQKLKPISDFIQNQKIVEYMVCEYQLGDAPSITIQKIIDE